MDAAVQLLNHYSMAGTLTPASYNDQQDDLNRMVNLINDAQMEIATTSKPIPEYLEIEVPVLRRDIPTAEIKTAMPEDFINATAIKFTPYAKGHRPIVTIDAPYYKWLNKDELLVMNRPAGTYRVEYTRYPARFDPLGLLGNKQERDALLATELDNTPDTHEAIPYYVAAMIALDEHSKAYYALYNVWETRLARMGYKPPHATVGFVDDVYGFDHFRGCW